MRVGVLIAALLISSLLSAQHKCGTVAPTSGEFEHWISHRIAEKRLRKSQRATQQTIYEIPVVVHIFHRGETVGSGLNLSDDRILAQIDSLNADFRRMNADAVNTPADFQAVAADSQVEFVLARQDPQGNPTDGIVRIRGAQNSYRVSTDKIEFRSESYWPVDNYLNIYVADLQTFIGFAAFPVTSLPGISNENDDLVLDAVFMDYEYFGNNVDAPEFESRGRTLTHEIGHFLGLRHIWGDAGCGGDDFVDDTPTARINHLGVTSPCTHPIPDDIETVNYDDGNTCTEEDDPDLPDMFQNYMDYTDDICMNLFTIGQRTRMRTVLENSPRRLSLRSSPGLIEPTRFLDDLAITKIISPDQAICNSLVTPLIEITNYGTNTVSSYDARLLIDGVPSGSVVSVSGNLLPLKKDTVSFPSQMISSSSTVSFEIFNVNGNTDGNTSNNSVSQDILFDTNINLPFSEDFENTNLMLGSIGSELVWEVTSAPRETIENDAIAFKSYNNTVSFGDQTILETPPLDLNGVPSATLSFSFAHSYTADEFQDGLVVKASTDCGASYPDVLFEATGTELQTASSTTSEFIPGNQLDWMDTILGISAYRDFDDVRFQFIGLNGGGNNVYLDNISIEETDVLENDISLRSVVSPLVTCDTQTDLRLQVRNAGSQTITSFTVSLESDGSSTTETFDGINIGEREYATFIIRNVSLSSDSNDFTFNVVEVNGVNDVSELGNSISVTVDRDEESDEYPLTLDFESTDSWINTSTSTTSLWERTTIDGNGVLKANSFNESELGSESWFISPALSTGGLDSAGLFFRASYASRTGLTDRLRVFASVNCGEDFTITLLDADSDSLAVTQTSQQWTPSSDSDWKEFRLDLSNTIPFQDEIRIAFVFINGSGNDLFLDEIRIQENESPTYRELFRVYPNPANLVFNLGFNLVDKEEVLVELINMNGKNIIQQRVTNALNQVLPFEAPIHPGLYFIRVSGNNFTQTQKLFINR